MIQILVTYADGATEQTTVESYSIVEGGVLKVVTRDGVAFVAPQMWAFVKRVQP